MLFIKFISDMFYTFFADSFILMVYIVYYKYILFMRLVLFILLHISILIILIHNYIVNLLSFFDHQIFFSPKIVLLQSVYFLLRVNQYILKYKHFWKILNDSFTTICTCFLVCSLNLNFDHQICSYLFFGLFILNFTFWS